MNIFVTGGAGQVGSTSLIEKLLTRGDTVVAIDNFATGRRDNLAPHAKLTLVEGTILDAALVDKIYVGPQAAGGDPHGRILQRPRGLGQLRTRWSMRLEPRLLQKPPRITASHG